MKTEYKIYKIIYKLQWKIAKNNLSKYNYDIFNTKYLFKYITQRCNKELVHCAHMPLRRCKTYPHVAFRIVMALNVTPVPLELKCGWCIM